jgi:hypothetical protein
VSEAPALAYAGARMAARHGARPSPAAWDRLERIGDFGQLVQSARRTGLAPWVAGLASDTGAHDMEAALRRGFRAHVEEVAGWHPPRWRPAIAWVAHLPDLPALAHALSDAPPPGWFARDPRWADLAGRGREARRAALEGGALAPLVAAWDGGTPLPEAWRAGLLAHWPGRPSAGLGRLLGRLERLGEGLPDGGAAAEARALPELRDAAERALSRAFRAEARTPVAALAHLGLAWIDVQRLRGALSRRRLLPAEAA